MKTVIKTFFIYFLFQMTITLAIISIKSVIGDIVVIILYFLSIRLLYRLYQKTRISGINKFTTLTDWTHIIIFSLIIHICYVLAESAALSFFLPNYSMNYDYKGLMLFSAIIPGPILEEIMFRGILLNQLNKKHVFWIANLIQALVFATLHFNIQLFIVYFLFGITVGIISKYRGIYYCILIHIFNNASAAINMVFFDKMVIELPKIIYLLIGVVFFIILLRFMIQIKKGEKIVFDL